MPYRREQIISSKVVDRLNDLEKEGWEPMQYMGKSKIGFEEHIDILFHADQATLDRLETSKKLRSKDALQISTK